MQDRSAAEKTKLDLPQLIVISEQRRSSVEKENLSEVKIMPEQERKSPDIYYCMTGRGIWGNIQLEGGSIGPSAARDNTEPES